MCFFKHLFEHEYQQWHSISTRGRCVVISHQRSPLTPLILACAWAHITEFLVFKCLSADKGETLTAGCECLILEQNTVLSFPFAINSHNAVLRWITCDISKVFGVTRNCVVFSQYSTQAFSIVCCTAFRTAAKHPRCHKWTFILWPSVFVFLGTVQETTSSTESNYVNFYLCFLNYLEEKKILHLTMK